jgi:hypothetical protein
VTNGEFLADLVRRAERNTIIMESTAPDHKDIARLKQIAEQMLKDEKESAP